MPLLITQNYGRGRTAVFATGGDWRWKMLQYHTDTSHEMFWRQLLGWLVNDTPTRVVASTPQPVLSDDGHLKLRAEVRDTTYLPAGDAEVQARIVDPDGSSDTVAFQPDATNQGVYTAEWSAEPCGIVRRRGDGASRNAGTWPRCGDVPARERRRGEFSSRAERTCWKSSRLKRAAAIIARKRPENWRRRSLTRTPESRCARRRTCGTCRRFFSWRFCCARPNGCCGASGAWYEVWICTAGGRALAARDDVLRDNRGAGRRAGVRAALFRMGQGHR